ncbi:hypothetical protein PAPYR_12396 [Paratrimastix pyriformis]|uniref:Uncharacterized protein n=1 Tax=Paratrimastix pyriformis TaxID=342808 RepID=A0ABQ8U4G7_9EUKA|nr:hypothetical protein PAPYR_12396 [Paratrimastix pyriformis]
MSEVLSSDIITRLHNEWQFFVWKKDYLNEIHMNFEESIVPYIEDYHIDVIVFRIIHISNLITLISNELVPSSIFITHSKYYNDRDMDITYQITREKVLMTKDQTAAACYGSSIYEIIAHPTVCTVDDQLLLRQMRGMLKVNFNECYGL